MQGEMLRDQVMQEGEEMCQEMFREEQKEHLSRTT